MFEDSWLSFVLFCFVVEEMATNWLSFCRPYKNLSSRDCICLYLENMGSWDGVHHTTKLVMNTSFAYHLCSTVGPWYSQVFHSRTLCRHRTHGYHKAFRGKVGRSKEPQCNPGIGLSDPKTALGTRSGCSFVTKE